MLVEALPHGRLQVGGVAQVRACGFGDRIELGAEEQITNQAKNDASAHMCFMSSGTRLTAPFLKRTGENGDRSIVGSLPHTRSAITWPVSAESKIPLRKWPAA